MKTVLLGDAIKRVQYKDKIPRNKFLNQGKYPVVSQEQELVNGYWDDEETVNKIERPIIVFGDHTKALKFIDFDFVLGADGVKILDPIDEIDPRYFYYALKNIELEDLGYARHFRILKESKINYPESIEEQKRIVKKLDEAFAAIDKSKQNTERNLQNSSELFSSILKAEFDKELDKFESEEIGQIFSFKNGRSFGKSEWSKEGLPIIRIQNLKNPNAEFNHYKGEYSKDIEIEDGDLLFSWSGTVGSSFGPHFWHGPTAVLNQHIFKLNKLLDIDETYAFFALKLITSEIEKKTHGAGGLVHVTKPTLQKFEIPLPPIEDQLKIAKYLEESQVKSQKLQELYRKKLAALEELRQSILKQAFEGKL